MVYHVSFLYIEWSKLDQICPDDETYVGKFGPRGDGKIKQFIYTCRCRCGVGMGVV